MAVNENLDQMDDEEYEIYQELSDDLIQAKELFSKGDYLVALNLASDVAQKAELENISKIEASAEGLIADVKSTIQQKTDESLRLIDEALKQDDPEKAQDVYTQAIQLDPENIALKTIERKIERIIEKVDREKKLKSLETRLRNHSDFGELREAIHIAEAMHPDETFSPELLKLYIESREAYEKIGQTFQIAATTMSSLSDLNGTAKIVGEIRGYMLKGLDIWYDAKDSTKDIPITDAFNKYKETLNEKFLSSVNDEHTQLYNDFLPAKPEVALERLNNRFSLFDDDQYAILIEDKYLAQLQKLRSEVEAILGEKEKALEILVKAEQKATTPIERLRYSVNAKEIFEHLEGIEDKIQRYKQNAAEYIRVQVENYLEQAQIYIDQNTHESFDIVKDLVEKADEVINSWFLPGIPKEVGTARENCNTVRAKLLQHENNYNLALEKIEDIRAKLEDPQKLHAALEEYEDLRKDSELSSFTDVKTFEKELVRKKEKSALQLGAERARKEGNWVVLAETCKALLQKDIGSEEREKIEKYSHEARAELLVVTIQNAVRLGDIPTAQKNLNQALALNPEVKERLSVEIDTIKKCAATNEDYAQLFRKAGDLAARADLASKLKALNIYRFLKGSEFIPDEDFPPYDLNFYTQQSEEKANSLSEAIRKDYLIPIIRFVDSVPSLERRHFIEAKKCFYDGRLLKSHHLITDETHKAKIYEAQKYFADLQNEYADELPNPDQLLDVWNQFKEDNPGNMEVERGYIEVLIKVTYRKAQSLAASNDLQEAVELIASTRKQSGLAEDMTLLYLLVDLLIDNHNYDIAEDELHNIPDNSRCGPRKKELTNRLIQQRELFSWIHDLEEYTKEERYIDALVQLISMEENRDLKGNDLLNLKKQEISQKGRNYYFRLAQPGLDSNATYTEKMKSVRYLIELGKFEDLINIPKTKRQSIQHLSNLSEELSAILPEMMNGLGNDATENLLAKEVEKHLREENILINSLLSICNTVAKRRSISEDVKSTLSDFKNNLSEAREQNAIRLLNLEKIKPLLEKASQNPIWESAWKKGAWTELNGIRAQINQSGFESLADAKEFRDHLDREKELYAYLNGKVQEIIYKFNEEEYEDVCEIFHEIKVVPMRIFPKTSNFQFDQALYEERRTWLDGKLDAADYWGDYHGWSEFDEKSQQRAESISLWKAWREKIQEEKIVLDRDLDTLNRNPQFKDDNARYQAWDDLQKRYEKFEEMIKECEGYEVESDRAEEIQKQAEALAAETKARIVVMGEKKGEKPSFPTADEFNRAIFFLNNNEERTLKELIEKAEKIGPSTPDEEARLKNAKKHHADYLEEKENGSLSKKLSKIFGRG